MVITLLGSQISEIIIFVLFLIYLRQSAFKKGYGSKTDCGYSLSRLAQAVLMSIHNQFFERI